MHINEPNPIPLATGEPTQYLPVNPARMPLHAMGTTLGDENDGISTYDKCAYINLSASGLVKPGQGQAYGVIINSHTGGTLKLWDNTAGFGIVFCETMTFAVGERFIPLLGATFGTGLFATIGGTANITILYR